MKLFEIKDRVRDHNKTDDLDDIILIQALDSGRRQVEQRLNAYWMRKKKSGFSLIVDTQDYSISAAGPSGLNLPNFKDARIAFVKKSTDKEWDEVDLNMDFEDAILLYATDEKGRPEVGVIDNDTLTLYPIPDATYDFLMYHYEWTSNPTQLNDDELTKRFPEALIYAADMIVAREVLKDFGKAAGWEEQMLKELAKIERHSKLREWPTKFSLVPKRGSNQRIFKRRNVAIWV